MNLQAIICTNAVGIGIVLMLWITTRTRIHEEMVSERLYRGMLLITMLQCLVETFTFAVDGRHFWGARQLAIASNAYLFAANISFAFIWSVYVDYRLYHSLRRLRKCYPLIAIPAMLIILGAVLNLFFPVFFVISKENVYSRTALANFAFGATYFYLIYSLWLVYRRRGKVEKYISMPVAVCMVPVFIGSLAQMFWYGVSLIWVSVAISLIALSGGLQSEEAYIDPLSGLFNRQYLNRNIDQLLQKAERGKYRAGIMLDIDRFKSINDGCGHLVGDQAIADAGQILRAATRKDDILIRFAGDEFIILLSVRDEGEIRLVTERIAARTREFNENCRRPYRLSFSMGYKIFSDEEESGETFIRKIDEAMYADKRKVI